MDLKFQFKEKPTSSAENELLDILIEEAAEVQIRATKLKRFGPKEIQPGQELNNIERLSMEIGDLLFMIDLASKHGLVSTEYIESGKESKHKQLKKFLKHQELLFDKSEAPN